MSYVAGYLARVYRGTAVDDPFSHGGEPSDETDLDWSTPTLVDEQEDRPVAVESSVEAATTEAPLAIVEQLTVYLEYGTDVRERDRVELLDGPHAGTYEVDGRPGHWLNPYTGTEAGTVVRLGKRTGG